MELTSELNHTVIMRESAGEVYNFPGIDDPPGQLYSSLVLRDATGGAAAFNKKVGS